MTAMSAVALMSTQVAAVSTHSNGGECGRRRSAFNDDGIVEDLRPKCGFKKDWTVEEVAMQSAEDKIRLAEWKALWTPSRVTPKSEVC
jgi:hypothetical protein